MMTKSSRTQIGGFPFDNVSRGDIRLRLREFLDSEGKHFIGVQNANKICLMNRDPAVYSILAGADLILPENAIYVVSLLLGRRLKGWNIGGYPTMRDIIAFSAKNSVRLFFLGSTERVLQAMVGRLEQEYPGVRVAGLHHGFFRPEEEAEVIERINSARSQILFVGMGSPRQEIWIARNLPRLEVKVAMGVGGSFKVIAGLEREAPRWTKFGVEWLYRSLQEPAKFKRYLVINPQFLFILLKRAVSRR